MDKQEKFIKRIIIASVVGLIVLILCLSSMTKVDSGYTGVRVFMGATKEETFNAGFHLKVPFFEKVEKVNNKVQKVEVSAASTSKDLQSVNSTLAINYHLAPESSVSMYKNIGMSYEDTILQPAIQEATKSVMAQYRAEELIQRRGEVSISIMDEISKKVSDYGILIDEFNITDFGFSQAFDDAIEQKLVAEQNKIKAATENEQRVAAAEADAAEAKARAEGEAESAKIKADGEAEALRIKAEGEAAAIKTKGEAEADANKKIQESLSKDVLTYKQIESWNGEYPDVMSGDSGNILIDTRD